MNKFLYLMMALQALEALLAVGTIGVERKPRTNAEGVLMVVVSAAIIYGFSRCLR